MKWRCPSCGDGGYDLTPRPREPYRCLRAVSDEEAWRRIMTFPEGTPQRVTRSVLCFAPLVVDDLNAEVGR